MCYTCGCNMPYDNMGDPTNITEKDIEAAGKTAAIQRKGTRKAKENMLKLLQLELERGELDKPQEEY